MSSAPGSRTGLRHPSDNAPLRLYTILSPAEHPDGTIHRAKAEATEKEHHHS